MLSLVTVFCFYQLPYGFPLYKRATVCCSVVRGGLSVGPSGRGEQVCRAPLGAGLPMREPRTPGPACPPLPQTFPAVFTWLEPVYIPALIKGRESSNPPSRLGLSDFYFFASLVSVVTLRRGSDGRCLMSSSVFPRWSVALPLLRSACVNRTFCPFPLLGSPSSSY